MSQFPPKKIRCTSSKNQVDRQIRRSSTLSPVNLGYISSKIQVDKVDWEEEFPTLQQDTNRIRTSVPKKIGYTSSKNQVDRQIRRSYSLFLIYLGYTSSKIQVDKVDSEEFLTQQNNSNTNELVSSQKNSICMFKNPGRQVDSEEFHSIPGKHGIYIFENLGR